MTMSDFEPYDYPTWMLGENHVGARIEFEQYGITNTMRVAMIARVMPGCIRMDSGEGDFRDIPFMDVPTVRILEPAPAAHPHEPDREMALVRVAYRPDEWTTYIADGKRPGEPRWMRVTGGTRYCYAWGNLTSAAVEPIEILFEGVAA